MDPLIRSWDDRLEINTDASLADPDWEGFVERHDERFGLAIHHLKSLVKGRRFDNEVMKVRVSKRGFYAQSRRFPAAFHGGTDVPTVRFVSEDEARAVTWEATALYRSGDAQSLTCIYDDGNPPEVFFGYRTGKHERFEIGELQRGLPIHVRVMVDSQGEAASFGARQGMILYQRTSDGRHVVLERVGAHTPMQPFGTIQE